jgi:hypothetical protein
LAPATATLQLVTPGGGSALSQALLTENTDTTAILTDYLASVPIPSGPFQAQVVGTDLQGRPVVQLWPTLFKPSALEVRFPTERMHGAAGSAVPVTVQITNGPVAQPLTLAFMVAPDIYAAAPTSTTLQLAAAEVRNLTVNLNIPAQTNHLNVATLTAFVTNPADSTATNTAMMQIYVDPAGLAQ